MDDVNYTVFFHLLTAFSCKEGEYLDMSTQECQKCAAGTHSLGTGVAFDEWDNLPAGFISHGINMDIGNIYTNCTKWVAEISILSNLPANN